MILLKIIVFFTLLLPQLSHAIVNIESLRMQNSEEDFVLSFQISFNKKEGNSNEDKINLIGQTQRRSLNTEHLALINYKFEESQSVRTEDQRLFHYRWGYFLSPKLTLESYIQWQEDHFKHLNFRGLWGLGVRHKVLEQMNLKFNVGYGLFRSKEEYESNAKQTDIEWTTRVNTYFSTFLILMENVNLESILYFQPSINLIKDYRIHWLNQINFNVNQHLTWLISYEKNLDNQPPEGIKKTDHEYGTALKIKF
ncbi:MAG: DUF481 domain-containing protein [Bdellovibrionales bacterium]|nr:DUF481 domain-containing protein [Bdellovibrionales bacterium]